LFWLPGGDPDKRAQINAPSQNVSQVALAYP
jgi:hypothetical protein